MKDTLVITLIWISIISGAVVAAVGFLVLRVFLSRLLWTGILLILAYKYFI